MWNARGKLPIKTALGNMWWLFLIGVTLIVCSGEEERKREGERGRGSLPAHYQLLECIIARLHVRGSGGGCPSFATPCWSGNRKGSRLQDGSCGFRYSLISPSGVLVEVEFAKV